MSREHRGGRGTQGFGCLTTCQRYGCHVADCEVSGSRNFARCQALRGVSCFLQLFVLSSPPHHLTHMSMLINASIMYDAYTQISSTIFSPDLQSRCFLLVAVIGCAVGAFPNVSAFRGGSRTTLVRRLSQHTGCHDASSIFIVFVFCRGVEIPGSR